MMQPVYKPVNVTIVEIHGSRRAASKALFVIDEITPIFTIEIDQYDLQGE